jgi:hypothetical protein
MRSTIITAIVVIIVLVVGIVVGYGFGSGKTTTITVTSSTTVTYLITHTITETKILTSTVTTYIPYTITTTITETKTITYSPTPTSKVIEAVIGQLISVDPWRVSVLSVREATYVKISESYYQAPQGMKVIIIKMYVENVGSDVRSPFGFAELSTPILVTDVNKSYDTVGIYKLDWILTPTQEVLEKAVKCNILDTLTKLAPGTYIEGDFIYLIPQEEEPVKLYMTYWPNPFQPKITIMIYLK